MAGHQTLDLSTQVQTGQITEQEAQQRIQQRMAEMFGVDAGQMPVTEQPQSTEDKISSLTEQMNERAQQAEQETAVPYEEGIRPGGLCMLLYPVCTFGE